MGLVDRFQHAWNAFMGRDPTRYRDLGLASYTYQGRARLTRGNNRSIVTSALNRIAVDVAQIDVEHVILDEQDRFLDVVPSHLNSCLTVEANIDQTARAFIEDVVYTMLDDGCVAVVPTEATADPNYTDSYDVISMRVGRIVEWYPQDVKVHLYNEKTGKWDDIVLSKRAVAIIQNPFYQIMNTPNSFYQKLLEKIRQLDLFDEQTASGKLDMIIQLPYVIKSEARRKQAEARRKDIEMQLTGSKYGIAYTDGTEKITQLNKSLENNLFNQIEYYMKQWRSQIGIPEEVFNGTADEKIMLNYQTRTLEPIISAITDELKRKFISKNARTRGYSIMFFKDPFSLVPVANIADIADRFTRNEILTSNEVRQIIGYKPSDDPKADELINANMPVQDTGMEEQVPEEGMEEGIQNG